jgi:peptide-methionine (S)-S-oxide reductase
MRYLLPGVLIMLASFFGSPSAFGVEFDKFPDPKEDESLASAGEQRKIVLAGGCFWCTEGVYQQIPGVMGVVSGYAGGTKETADYETVSTGTTDHAEAIEITYDAGKTTLGQLLKVFFAVAHDPTQLNRQGPDHGRQYRSAIFYANDEQKRIAEAYIRQLTDAKVYSDKIVTTLEPLKPGGFYPAEAYHQNFVKRNPRHGYIVQQALPKVEKAKKAAAKMAATTQPK